MFETEIIRILILPLGIISTHLIRSPAGCILVDAGIPGSERKIGRALARVGLSYRDIKLIVVTQAHTDHAGSAARLRDLSGAPILAHRDDADFYRRKADDLPPDWPSRQAVPQNADAAQCL
ncbi:MBL fold metallo-hydrolase [Lichenihabitans psoromatis]|uniref:MBL fold metallo-hydrolase n=1 Tax=Lichenihabitans psoromatis TaxID=2528642 RepID=UPI001AECE23B|nr:MBL fold metallo-hydrolase [Lichenihabitans psoromatis]